MRIIAGQLRGRPLRAPPGLTTRPTSDRARQAIFNILGELHDLRVLDVYAGTGALGIEALSRGAAHAVFIESDRQAAAAIRGNLERLGVSGRAALLELPAGRTRTRLERAAPFDLVLADPPWPIAATAALEVASLVRGLVAPGGRVLLGHPADRPVALDEATGLVRTDLRHWGGSGMSFFSLALDSDSF